MRRAVGRSLSRSLILVAVLLVGTVAVMPHDEPDGGFPRYRVLAVADQELRDTIAARGMDISGHDLVAGRIEVIVGEEGLSWLDAQAIPYEILDVREAPTPLAGGEGVDVPLADQNYTSPAEMEVFLAGVAADHPAITRLVTLGTSVEGRPIQGLLVSDNAAVDEDELTFLMSGAHHSREVMTPEIIMDAIDLLTDGYGVDPDVTRRIDDFQIWLVPIVNPDGVHRVHTVDDFWRKNVRDNDSNATINSQDGVDLNRNYEWGWGGQCQGSSSTFSNQTYRGPSEGSEPETQAMVALGRAYTPVFDIEFHSHGEDVFYAMSCDPTQNPSLSTIGGDGSISRIIAEDYASRIIQADGGVGYLSNSYGSRVDGTGRDLQYHENGSIAFVTEVNNSSEGGFHPSYNTYRQPTVEGQRPGWEWLIDRMHGPAVGGRILDADTGAPVQADVSLDEMSLPDGKRLTSSATFGRYHLIVVPGSYTLRVSAPGYQDAVVPVTVVSSSPVHTSFQPTDVLLTPVGGSEIFRAEFEDAASVSLWTVGDTGDNASDGQWEWGEPDGTFTGSIQGGDLVHGAPMRDATPGPGYRAFVTGNEIGATMTSDDVDKGTTSIVSPAVDLSGTYGATLTWHRWLSTDGGNQDGLDTQLSDDGGQSWQTVESLQSSTSTPFASPAWGEASVVIEDYVTLGADVRVRFQASDGAGDNVVEAAVDDVIIRGFVTAVDGDVKNVAVSGKPASQLSWQAIPGGGAAVYDVIRGDLSNLSGGPGGVSLGTLTCIEDDSTDLDTSGNEDGALPAPGTGFYYAVRFELGTTVGGWGFGSAGGERTGTGGCSP